MNCFAWPTSNTLKRRRGCRGRWTSSAGLVRSFQLAVKRLNFRRRDLPERSCAKPRTDVPCEQTPIIGEALRPQPRPSADVEPVIEVLANGLPGGADVATVVPLREHAIEVGMRGPEPAIHEFANVLAPPGFPVTADVDADHSHLRSTADDLANLASHLASKMKKAAHV